MPKGAKKRAKLKKKQQQGHHDDGGNSGHNNGSGSDNNNGTSGRRDPDHLRIPPKDSHVDASEDSMESSEEMVTPRAAGSEADDDERKTAPEVPVQVVEEGNTAAGEEVMVDALPPETSGQGKDDAEVEVHAVVQEPEVKDVVVDEALAVQEPEVAEAPVVEVPEVKREVAKVHLVHEPEPKVDEVVVVEETHVPPVAPEPEVKSVTFEETVSAPSVQEPEAKSVTFVETPSVQESEAKSVTFVETVSAPSVQEPEAKGGDVVIKDSAGVSGSREADVHTTEVVRGPAVAVAASGQRATWWNCCGLFDAFSGSQRLRVGTWKSRKQKMRCCSVQSP